MGRIASLLFGMLLSASVCAAGPGGVRKTVEASMQVTGEVVIAPDGSLQSYALDKPEALPAEVKALLARYLPACEFSVTTASGKPETVTAKMSLQLLARPDEAGGFTISVNGSQFQDPDTPASTAGIRAVDVTPPNYPLGAAYSGMSGTVYVVLRLDPDGSVAEAHAERVDMTVVASDAVLRQGRNLVAKAALVKARKWRFSISPEKLTGDSVINVRVPIDFTLVPEQAGQSDAYGKWRGYVPGPYKPVPWRTEPVAEQDLGALLAGGLYPLDSRIKLRKPSGGI